MGTSDNRYRDFATIVYPESAPKNWREILSDLHVQALVSPLHNRDEQEGGGIKKEHYHVQLYFNGKKSLDHVMELVSKFGGVGCIKLESKSGYARYLTHMDNPEKAQYKATDVRCYGGADYQKWALLDNDVMMYIPEIMDFIDQKDIRSFYVLCKYASMARADWLKVLATRNTLFFKEYIKSRKWAREDNISVESIIEKWIEEN